MVNNSGLCSQCGARVTGFNKISYKFGETVLCESCYNKITHLKQSRGFTSLESLEANKKEVMEELQKLQYRSSVVNDIMAHFQTLAEPFEDQDIYDSYLVTTGASFEGIKVLKYNGIVSGESVLGTGFLSSLNAVGADFFGSEAQLYSEKMRAVRRVAQVRAIKDSIARGGNAIVGLRIEYENFANDMIGVVVTGTSVTVEEK